MKLKSITERDIQAKPVLRNISMRDYNRNLMEHVEKHVTLSQEEKELLASFLKTRRILTRQYLLQADTVCQYESFVVERCLRMFLKAFCNGQQVYIILNAQHTSLCGLINPFLT